MTKSFNSRAAAIEALSARGYREVKTGAFASRCKGFRATVHPVGQTSAVIVFFEPVE